MRRAGFVLVGGQSTRMGRDKALLPLDVAGTGNSVLVQRVAAQVAAVASSIAIIGPPERYGHLGFECLPDLQPGLGPISGIHAALSQRRAEYNLIVACDMPCLSLHLLSDLFDQAETAETLCAAAEDDIGVHPLCAVYRSAALPRIELAMRDRRLRLTSLLDELDAVRVRAAMPVENCNTPEEWQHFQATVVP